ncbi:MAG: hypothetical protein HY843_02430 [Bdellovibrio sp.]|nr:hypothetical protein [Bdellovibrio sp.]
MLLEHFFEAHQNTLEGVSLKFKRFLHYRIDWGERVIGIVGPRGVVKTTLLLQHYLEKYQSVDRLLYV